MQPQTTNLPMPCSQGSGAFRDRPVGRPRKLNLHCLPGSTTYLTQMEEHGFALHLTNASGCGPC